MLFIGIVMIVFPGPAFIVIPAGLAILATQFEWARRLRDRFKDYLHQKRMDWIAAKKRKNSKN